jgi:hypothetical protein
VIVPDAYSHALLLLMPLQLSSVPWPLLSSIILCAVGRIPLTGDQPFSRPLPTQETQVHNKHTFAFLPRVGFETATPMFEWRM